MLTRPTHRPAQTIKQAKAEYQKYGPRISTQDARQLERGAELYRRAEIIKNNEKRRKAALKRKHEKETRDREVRRRMHIASQKPYLSQHQVLMSNFLETGNPDTAGSDCIKIREQVQNERNEPDPWEGDALDDRSLLDAIEPVKEATSGALKSTSLSKERILKHQAVGEIPQWQVLEPRKITPPRVFERRASPAVDNKTTTAYKPGPTPMLRSNGAEQKAQELQDGWEDFFVSSTQIEREITSILDTHIEKKIPSPIRQFELLSTQDVTFSAAELEELDRPVTSQHSNTASTTFMKPCPAPTKDRDRVLMPPPRMPCKVDSHSTCRKEVAACDDLHLSDFTLSTQDCREIMG